MLSESLGLTSVRTFQSEAVARSSSQLNYHLNILTGRSEWTAEIPVMKVKMFRRKVGLDKSHITIDMRSNGGCVRKLYRRVCQFNTTFKLELY